MLGSQSLAGAQQQGVVSSVKRVQPCTARLHGSFSSRPQHCSHTASSFCSGAPLFTRPSCHVHRDSRCQRGSRLVVKADTDFYDVLGVPRSADKKAIKQAYRAKARQYHPDVNKEAGAEDRFKQISNAYEVLSDDNKKAIYDKYGEAGLKGGMGGMGGAQDFSSPFDMFEQFFGRSGGFGGMDFGAQGRGARRQQPGDDEKYELQIDFLEAVFGCNKEIDVSRLEGCATCSASGVKAGTSATTCATCQGNGQVVQVMRTPIGAIQQLMTCPDCQGTGESFTPCGTCGGDGRVRKSKRISLRVPAGVDTGSRLRVRGEGNSGRRGGETGDLYVFLTVKEHATLRREGTTIHSDVVVSYVDAILGTTVKADTVDGPVDLRIPAGTQPGTTLVMAKRGVPRLGSTTIRGDHQVHVRVNIPSKLSSEEKKLVEELREMRSGAKQKAGRGFFG